MMMATLKTHLWVNAQVRTWTGQGLFTYVAHKGDPERGGLMIKRVPLNGTAELYERALSMDGNPVWRRFGPEGGEPEQDADARIAKRLGHDQDLWVLEVEDPSGNLVLDAPLESNSA